jgi:hypothetical protein
MNFMALSLVQLYESSRVLFRRAPHPATTHFYAFPTRIHIIVAHIEAYSLPCKDPHRSQALHATSIAPVPGVRCALCVMTTSTVESGARRCI